MTSADHNLLCEWLGQFICFGCFTYVEKDTFFTLIVKLLHFLIWDMYISDATKSYEVISGWSLPSANLLV